MSTAREKEISIPGLESLKCNWSVGNVLCLYSSQNKSGHGSSPKELRWETGLFSGIYRKLVNESALTFLNLQKTMSKEGEEEEGTKKDQALLRISRQYRSILKDIQHRMDQDTEDSLELLYKLELLWNLAEILLVQKTRFGIILPQLLQWITLHFQTCDELTRQILSEDILERPETHPNYWKALILFLLQGRTDQALKLLHLHSDMNLDPFLSLDELIRKMPFFKGSNMSIPDFEFRWNRWQSEVNSRILEGNFSTNEEVSLVAGLLSGSEKAFIEVVPLCETWYQWMTGKLLYTNPIVKVYNLPYHAEHAISQFGGLDAMCTLDSVILATIEMDVPAIMHELCSTLDNFWFPAHLLDLLFHSESLEEQGPNNKGASSISYSGLREFLLLEYATSLVSHHSLWQVGVLYFDHCPVQGPQRLEAIFERIPINNESRANKVINMALERNMTSVVTTTCKVMGMKMLKEGRIGSAMTWGLRSQDVKFTTFLADRLLLQYCNEGEFSSIDLLDNLGSAMMISDRLTFLAKYREFHKLCSNSEFRIAANLLHSLLWSRLAPKYFWVTLLMDASSFLISDDVLFSSEQIYELMHCLQELVNDMELPKKQKALLDQHEGKIRIKLAKTLALALMNEADTSNNNICLT
ncbi:nuclear pore complex protein Nup85 [Lepeophtheirus salmonis]|uniref:nuclear pore complex protein Nup85 n=1 Tax=Lepeophtheirus salmonis TaxID=72036 RepID=UPI001AE7B6BB|nr:nuclear pore complex protein Nup85-like [Lepeophtheirus salmonis]